VSPASIVRPTQQKWSEFGTKSVKQSSKQGGFIIANRVGGQLALSRSIGDHSLRTEGVIPNPSIKRLIIRPSDRWLIIATDGVWDALTEAVSPFPCYILGHLRPRQGRILQKTRPTHH
jgi:hypothetical protein